MKTCPVCHGKGQVERSDYGGSYWFPFGRGRRVSDEWCKRCDGKGLVDS